MKKYRVRRITIFLFIIVMIPVLSFLTWYFKKSRILNIMIVDKTVPVMKRNEHRSLSWILTHGKYTNSDKRSYSIDKDYFGFFPVNIPTEKDSGKYLTKNIDHFKESSLDSLADKLDMIYFTDTYGVYYNEWYRHKRVQEYSERIYGGLSDIDVNLIEKLKNRKKLIITEFNFFASPTNLRTRNAAEKILGIHWKGWTFRYFDQLDTNINKELPHWVVSLYKAQHHNCWSFKKSGIVMHHEPDDILEILDGNKDLTNETPVIFTNKEAQEEYNLPAQQYYPYWFDYTDTIGTQNEIIAHYKFFTNNNGDSILRKVGLPNEFPCIIRYRKPNDYTYYYFCGDFADNPIENMSSYFRGIRLIDFTFYSNRPNDRTKFFWKYYYPLVNTILSKYYKQIKNKN